MPRTFYSRKNSSLTGTAAAIVTAVTAVTAITALCAAKLTAPQFPAVVTDDNGADSFYTRAANLDDFIKEQRARLHPFDIITHAGYSTKGEYEITVERAPYVTVADKDGEKTVRALKGETAAEMLSREGIRVGTYDFVDPPLDAVISENCTVTITEAFPVTVCADGQEFTAAAAGITVGELLVREGIKLGGHDELSCSTDDIVSEGMTVYISRVEYKERSKTQVIPYDTEYTETPNLKTGESMTVTEGIDGSATVTITDKYIDGEIVSSEETGFELNDAVNEVIARGTAVNTPYSTREGDFRLENGVPTEYEYVLNGKVTAYYAPEGSGTYSGRPLVIGSVGVDPDVIPFGSELYIVSEDGSHVYGYAVASDTGDIKGTGIICDAYMGTEYEDCLWWQAQYCNVYVLSVGDNSVSWR